MLDINTVDMDRKWEMNFQAMTANRNGEQSMTGEAEQRPVI
jgi:hypothetical protein